MKQLLLRAIRYRMFKGLQEYDLELNGANATILGRNAAQKTTLLDGFLWLLFGRDSHDSATFEVKTIVNGEILHKQEHSVEAVFDLGGDTLTLKRLLKEKWQRRRGDAHETLTGHETSYFVDEVPVSKSRFDEAVRNLIGDEKVMRMLSEPTYFNDRMSWQERRKVLLELAGDIDDAQVIKADKSFKELATLLGKHSHADYREIVKGRKTEWRKKLDSLPGRIREVSLRLTNGPSVSESEKALAALEKQQAKEAKRLEAARSKEREAHKAVIEAEAIAASQHRQALREHDEAGRASRDAASDAAREAQRVLAEGRALARLRLDANCPTCGREFEDTKAHAEEHSKRIDALRAQYQDAKAKADELQAEADKHQANAPQPDTKLVVKAKAAHAKALAALDELKPVDLSADIRAATIAVVEAKAREEARARMEALKAEEREAAQAFEEQERQLFLLEAFDRAKMALVEKAVNDKFELCQWRLFEPQLNGGVKDVADATVNGVPYGNLNTGARLNAGIDLINVLSAHYKFAPPIILDGAEALTSILPTRGQLIQLRVSEDDPVLRVVIEQQKVRKAA